MRHLLRAASLLALTTALSACVVGPDYSRPSVETPLAFKQGGTREDSAGFVASRKNWRAAAPNDGAERGDWWRVFRDPTLDRLIRLVDVDNQSLRQSVANFRQARALVESAQAALYPTVVGAPSITRSRTVGTERTSVSIQGQASWELDLFGRIRRTIETEAALAQADAATLALTRLTIQAEVANNYLSLRYADSLVRVLNANVENFKRTVAITENQYNAGVAARSDVITAQTQVQTTQAAAIAATLTRAQFENAIATLIGRPPSELSLAVAPLALVPPAVPVGIPASLLERRPDVAQAERAVQAQSEQIGVAVAALYPSVTLSASGGISGLTRTGLLSAANQVWAVTAAGSEVLFDGGARSAAITASRAGYDASVANYRQTVLAAFADVENGLVGIRILARQQVAQDEAVTLARRAVEITLNEYRAGTQNFTTVVTAQALQLNNEVAALQVRLSRFTTAVSLIRALGGGWDARALPSDSELKGPRLPIDLSPAVHPDE
ncbi:efflux transporter outer membrane subunit [Methylobacterium sp. WL103]|uniref:efflux transporter outer membrane subunit n=1 Tax=unclassified Methylobacterium TaxID=2615210 RepID=UPI0011C7A348|nr:MULTISPECIES: efflux transporter outer membrane subunit [unclassified Methylobacterium]TXM65041.1 efflux transporter outer membrane subunit [Methylobacterium sp. WL120]TXN06076.1 efflux transporter outer membrane subunit [Methylobacterium sp. WL103]